ncbi:MAG: glucose-6-phosphate dehydrogenase [Gemmatimonadota bacterium]|nr:glucose-6-phosphate dehydrogenase [Gemmatimonadota bacterium]
MPNGERHDCTFVLLGGTGDLAYKKIIPALARLRSRGDITDRCAIIGVARDTGMDDESYRTAFRQLANEHGVRSAAVDGWIASNVFYQPLGRGEDGFAGIAARITDIERERGVPPNRIFYMALPPGAFPSTIAGLGEAGLSRSTGWTRLVVEKPFGRDLDSARDLNALVHRHFDESQVYRIDHYLGKETVQNLLVFRFANAVFESLWNRNHVESVQITVAEDIGIEDRAAYYEQTGAVRDIVQNHGTQLLALVAMEIPAIMNADSIRQEKVKVLNSIHPITPQDVVLGQYERGRAGGEAVPGYREEDDVSDASRTATYAALRIEIDNWRWQGVPFFLRTGKRLPKRLTEIEVKFRRPPVWMFRPMGSPDVHRNVLRLTIQPQEGFALLFHVKAPGKPLKLERLPLDFCYDERFKEIPEAYQTLLLDVMEGDQTLFVRADEVEAAWRLYAPVLDDGVPVSEYAAGTWGPEAADALLARSGHWWSGG